MIKNPKKKRKKPVVNTFNSSWAQEELNVFTTGFLRFFFGFLIITPYILKTKFEVFSTKNLKIHILRSVLNLPAMLLGFAAAKPSSIAGKFSTDRKIWIFKFFVLNTSNFVFRM